MSATNTFEDYILKLIFTATPIANLADNAASSPITEWYISLHTADPGEAGSQNTSEAAYTGYARLSVSRDTNGWTVSSGSATNDSEEAFGQCTASPGSNLTHVGLGTASTGAGALKLYNELSAPVIMQVGTTPLFPAGELEFTCN
jgi:hypothetical protein